MITSKKNKLSAISEHIASEPYIGTRSYDSLKGIQQETILSKVFFHPKNVDIIQKQIIMETFKRTNGNYLIKKQNESDVHVVMRSIFLQHAKHLQTNIKQQIIELNNLVVNDVVPGIINEIKTHDKYIKQVFGPVELLDRPVSTSNAGLKSLPSITNIWNKNKD